LPALVRRAHGRVLQVRAAVPCPPAGVVVSHRRQGGVRGVLRPDVAPDGRRISRSDRKALSDIWARSRRREAMRTLQAARSVSAIAHTPDGASLWVGDALGRVHLLDLASGKSREVFRVVPGRPTWPVRDLVASADGKLVLASSEYPWALWDVGAARVVPL